MANVLFAKGTSTPTTTTLTDGGIYFNTSNKNIYLNNNGNIVTFKGTDTNTTYSAAAGGGLSLSGTAFSVNTGYTTSGKNYAVKVDSTSGGLYVNVPWTDTNTDTNTWKPNTVSSEGYVSAGSGQSKKVWKTDASGNPSWRDPLTYSELSDIVRNQDLTWNLGELCFSLSGPSSITIADSFSLYSLNHNIDINSPNINLGSSSTTTEVTCYGNMSVDNLLMFRSLMVNSKGWTSWGQKKKALPSPGMYLISYVDSAFTGETLYGFVVWPCRQSSGTDGERFEIIGLRDNMDGNKLYIDEFGNVVDGADGWNEGHSHKYYPLMTFSI